jgi:hypothetical protein
MTDYCGSNGLGPMSCLSAVVFQNIGGEDALTSYYCGLDPIVNPQFTSPTYYRTLTANAAGMITLLLGVEVHYCQAMLITLLASMNYHAE